MSFNSLSTAEPYPRRSFYGWWIVGAAWTIFLVSAGLGFYAHGLLLDPLCQKHGWSKSAVSVAFTIYYLATAACGLIVGRQVDLRGSRPILVIGAILFGLAMALLGQIQAQWQLYAVYLLMAVGYSGLTMTTVGSLLSNWFVRRRGLAMGLAMTGLSVGGLIMSPAISHWLTGYGLETALVIMGGLAMVLVIPTSLFVVKQRPADLGQVPDGGAAEAAPTDPALVDQAPNQTVSTQTRLWTRAQAMKTHAFWAIVATFLLGVGAQTAFLVHLVSFLTPMHGAAGAAWLIGLLSGASLIGRLVLSGMVDRFDKRAVAATCFLIQGLAVLTVALSGDSTAIVIGIMVCGLVMGGVVMLQPLLIAECFGMRSFGTVAGVNGVFADIGLAVGPSVAGFIYDATRSYQLAFILAGAASLVAMALVFFARPPR